MCYDDISRTFQFERAVVEFLWNSVVDSLYWRIATFCVREGYELLHRDRDFDPFESELGLRVVKA